MSIKADISTSTRVGYEGTLFISVPDEAVNKLKTANLLGMKPDYVMVQCYVKYVPDTYEGEEDAKLF